MKTKTLLAALFVTAVGSTASFAGGPPVMYVVVDRVETSECKGKLASIQIWGCFTRQDKSGRGDYSSPAYGFIQFGYGSDADAPKWRKAAGSGKAVTIGSCGDGGAFLTTPIYKCVKEAGEVVAYPKDYLERWGDLYGGGHLDGDPAVRNLIAFANAHVAVEGRAMSNFIKESIIDGLKEDGVPRDFAGKLAKNPDYLGKCPLCAPTQDAFVQYSHLETQPKGKGLTADLQDRLNSADIAKRQGALRELVQKYIERGYTHSKLSADDQKAMRQLIEKNRVSGLKGLPNGQKFCPSCDGAACTLAR
jgi:hypothetical protein